MSFHELLFQLPELVFSEAVFFLEKHEYLKKFIVYSHPKKY